MTYVVISIAFVVIVLAVIANEFSSCANCGKLTGQTEQTDYERWTPICGQCKRDFPGWFHWDGRPRRKR